MPCHTTLRVALLAAAVAAGGILLRPSTAPALIAGEDVIWGFEGRVVPGRVNPVFVRVINDKAEPFSGSLRLYQTLGVGGRIGATHEAPCFVSPFTERWVSFAVYIGNGYGQWETEWGDGLFERQTLPQPRLGPPGRVMLLTDEDRLARGFPFKTFPAHLFPPSVAATDGLYAVVLDAVPRWEPARRQALLDWLHGGGIVHLLQDRDGRYPVFAAELDALNDARERFRVGAGLVARHPITRDGLTEDYLARQGFPAPVLDEQTGGPIYQLEDALFSRLRALVGVRHRWKLIFSSALVYLALVGPANAWLSRRWRSATKGVLFFLGLVVVFSAVFILIGRRGYGERAVVHSIAVARALGAGRYDATEWCSAFATRSRDYTFQADAGHNVYATCEESNPVNGTIENGPKGHFTVSIPLYASVTFLHRGVQSGPDVRLGAETAPDQPFVIRVHGDLPDRILDMCAFHRDRFYPLDPHADRLEPGEPQTPDVFLPQEDAARFMNRFFNRNVNEDEDPDAPMTDELRGLMRVLIARSVGQPAVFQKQANDLRTDPDRIRVFFFVRPDAAATPDAAGFAAGTHYALYQQDVFL